MANIKFIEDAVIVTITAYVNGERVTAKCAVSESETPMIDFEQGEFIDEELYPRLFCLNDGKWETATFEFADHTEVVRKDYWGNYSGEWDA